MNDKEDKESTFDAELYRLNKPKTERLWLLPALQYFYAKASSPRSQTCHRENLNSGVPITELGALKISE